MSENPDWMPVKNGEEYCSPACGCGCTQAEFELANMRAERLAARLNEMPGGFKDWSLSVWENTGWHYEAVREIDPEPETGGSYCHLSESFDREGNPNRYYCDVSVSGIDIQEEAETPEEALMAVMLKLTAVRDSIILSFRNFKAAP